MSTPGDSDLRTQIRWRLATGALPRRSERQRLYGGRGEGQPCACCGRPVCATDVLYEVESPGHLPLAMHLQCFEVWEIESLDQQRSGTEPGPDAAPYRPLRIPVADE